jgi:1-acyl-sn-glycerol-3-phosphate acyltransferase
MTSLLAALGVLLAPWLLMPARAAKETSGLVGLLWWLNAGYCAFWHRLALADDDPLPPEGSALLISNHTCCIDHMLLQASTSRLLGFMIAKELYDIWLFKPFCALSGCIPVRRDGRDVSATRGALRALGEGRVVPVFPEGKITPTSGRELGPGKPGVAYLALRAGVPVIPAYIWGTPETIKVGPSYWTPSRARVLFGPPVDLADLTGNGRVERDDVAEVTERLMAAIRRLRDEVQSRAGSEARDLQGTNVDRERPQGGTRPVPLVSQAVGRP